MKKILVISLAALFLITGTGFAKMRGGGGGGGDAYKMPHGKWWKIPAVQEELKITEEEQKVLDGLYTDSRRKMIDLKAAVEKEKLELEILLDSSSFTKKAAMKQFAAVENAKRDLAKERFSFIAEARELFGQERFAKICSKRKAFMKKGYHQNMGQCPALGGKSKGDFKGKNCPRFKDKQ